MLEVITHPDKVLEVDDKNLSIKRKHLLEPLLRCALNDFDAQVLSCLPLRRLLLPHGLGNTQGGDNQHRVGVVKVGRQQHVDGD